jgi:hypothetical protein
MDNRSSSQVHLDVPNRAPRNRGVASGIDRAPRVPRCSAEVPVWGAPDAVGRLHPMAGIAQTPLAARLITGRDAPVTGCRCSAAGWRGSGPD